MKKILLVTSAFLCLLIEINAQQIPLSSTYSDRVIQSLQQTGQSFTSSFKPWLIQDLDTVINIDSVLYPVGREKNLQKHLVTRKIFSENLIRFRYDKAWIYLDPLFDFSIGYDIAGSKTVWNNTRGFMVSGGIGRKLSFNTEFYENQAVVPAFMDTIIRESKVVPGQGYPKSYKTNGYDYFFCNAGISYVPSKYVDFTLGYGKNFIGDGYRSMILSDASFCYPYFRFSANFWKIKYTVMYSQFIDLNTPTYANLGWDRKWSTMHYLQILLFKRLNIGLYDAIIWGNADSTGYRGFDIQYLNPVIFLRPIEESLHSPDNALIGFTFNVRVTKHFNVYGQLMFDEFKLSQIKSGNGWWANKYGYQLGISGWNLFNVENLNARLEYNAARPYTYSSDTSLKAYGHYNQPLAHPLGANFREGIGIVNYRYGHWAVSFKLTYAMYGADTTGLDYGKNIFRSYDDYVYEYGNKIGQGLKTNLLTTDTRIAFLLNPRTNMRVEAGFMTQNLSSEHGKQSSMVISLGFKTSLMNFYNDFR